MINCTFNTKESKDLVKEYIQAMRAHGEGEVETLRAGDWISYQHQVCICRYQYLYLLKMSGICLMSAFHLKSADFEGKYYYYSNFINS